MIDRNFQVFWFNGIKEQSTFFYKLESAAKFLLRAVEHGRQASINLRAFDRIEERPTEARRLGLVS